MKKALPILLLMVASAFIPFLYTSANFPETFDLYRQGTLNPGLWKFQTNNNVCFPNSGGGTSEIENTRIIPLSPPNAYLINTQSAVGASCAAGNYGVIQQWFNSSFPAVQVVAWVRNANFSSTPAAGKFDFVINLTSYNGNSHYVDTNTNFTDANTIGATYRRFTSTVPSLPGNNVSVKVGFIAAVGSTFPTGSPAAWSIDNVSIIEGNQIITGHNFDLVNSTSTQWFSIASYLGSRIQLNYTSSAANDSNQWAPNGVLVPDINYSNLGTSRLITVYIGNIYSRSLIPQAHTHMILDNPASVVAYTISVIGLPNQYGPLSKIFIQSGGRNITSGYLDSAAKFAAALIPGNYVVIVTSQDGSNTQIQTLNFPATSSALTFNAYSNIIAKNGAGVVSAITWSAAWNGTAPPPPKGIVVNYVDTLNSTCGASDIGITIKRTNGSGAFNVFSSYYSTGGCVGSFSVTIPANSNQLNYTISNQLSVYLNATNFFGTHFAMGSQGLACFNCLLLSNPNLPTDTLGLGILPGITWLNLIAFGILTFTAGAFGIYWSRFGFFITACEVAFFVYAGWLNITSSIGTAETFVLVFIVLAFTGLMTWHERT